jgi:hypothetical protein
MRHGEVWPGVRAPGAVGDDTSAARTFATTLAQIDPCDQANVQLVCNFQTAAGLTPDGKYGDGTAKAAQAQVPGAPAGCHPRPAWWAPHWQSNCAGSNPVALRRGRHSYSQPMVHPTGVGAAPGDALFFATKVLIDALSRSPGYPNSIACSDANVASAAAAFQGVYNASPPVANTTAPATGVYDAGTQEALQAAINAYAMLSPPVSFSTGSAAPACAGPSSTANAATASPAAQALAAVNPCDQANVAQVWAFQQSVGQDPDGKYGTATAHKLATQMPNAPPGCHPRPGWWAPHGQKNLPGGGVSPAPTTRARIPPIATLPPLPPPPPMPSSPGTVVVVPPVPPPIPEKKERGLSTRTLIAGGIGAVALIGIVAAASSGKGREE